MSEVREQNAGGSNPSVVNVLLLVVCFAIFALFIYDYLKKNKEIAEYKKQDAIRADGAEKRAQELEVKLTKVKELANLYKKTMRENARARAMAQKAEKPKIASESTSTKEIQKVEVANFATGNDDDVARINIARKVSSDLAPIISKVNKSQTLTNEKLDKAISDLIMLLDKETAKSLKISKSLTKVVLKERKRGDMLQRKLTLTNGVVTDLSAFATELGTLYVNAHEDDSVLGNIGTAAMTPVKVVQNTLSLNLCFGRDKMKAEKRFKRELRKIMSRYRRIENLGLHARHTKIKEPKLKKRKNK